MTQNRIQTARNSAPFAGLLNVVSLLLVGPPPVLRLVRVPAMAGVSGLFRQSANAIMSQGGTANGCA